MPLTAEKKRSYDKRKSRERFADVAEIGDIPAVVNPRRKELCRFDLLLYLQSYYPHSTGLSPFSPGHIRAIERIQRAFLFGGYFLQIVFRGWAKSTITEGATAWGVGYGHCCFPVPIAADATAAKQILDSLKAEFETNDLLLEDFPEICYPIRCLEGKPQRCKSQTHRGERTHIEWTAKHIVLPVIPGSLASGSVIKPRGIEANIRGLRHKRTDGIQARPDLILLDDPQTDESARNQDRITQQLSTLNKAILRLGGHKKRLAAVCNATIIEAEDMIDQLSDAKRFPAWQTERIPMLASFATNQEKLWLRKYADIRNGFNPDLPGDQDRAHREATELYRTHQAEMDEGAAATWLSCFEDDTEISAIQHAYNIIIDTSMEAFMAECQNAPLRNTGSLKILKPGEMCAKQSGYGQREFPRECTTLTAFVDVHQQIHYWQVWAWEPKFTGYLIDYGTFPNQQRRSFRHDMLAVPLEQIFPGFDDPARITAGLDALLHGNEMGLDGLLRREWVRGDGVPLRIAKCGVDANGEHADAIKKFIRQRQLGAVLYPSFGRGVKATESPISRWTQSKGKGMGPEWVDTRGQVGDPQGIMFDTNFWKTQFHRKLSLPNGSQGAIYLFKTEHALDHQLVANHWYAERPKEVVCGSRIVHEFPSKFKGDNHYFDCAIGNLVAASKAGIRSIDGPKAKTSLNLADLQRQRWAREGRVA